MPYRSSKQWSARILSCLFLLTTVVAVEMFHNKQINFLKNEAFSEAKRQLAIVRSRIEAVIVTDMYLLNGMSTQVAIDPKGSPEDWNKIADSNYSRWRAHSVDWYSERRCAEFRLSAGRQRGNTRH